MPRFLAPFPLFCFLLLAGGAVEVSSALAQDRSTSNWKQRKAERFRPITDAQRMAIVEAVPAEPTVKPERPRRVLVFYRCEGFIHTSIPHGNLATQEMGRRSGAFQADLADTYDVFTAENLNRYDALVLNNTTHLEFPKPEQEQALLDFVAGGKGLVGYHAASDNFYDHPQAAAMIGGQFNGHPWGAGGTWAFKLDDPEHTLNRSFGLQGFWHQDEIYQYRPDTFQGPTVLRLLVSLDMTKDAVRERIDFENPTKGYESGPRQVPVSWVRSYDRGRVFVTNLGHREETFANPTVLQHMFDGIQFALGDLQVDTRPTAESEPRSAAFAPPLP